MSNKNKKPKRPSKNTPVVTKSYDLYRIDWKDHFSATRGWDQIVGVRTTPLICVSVGIRILEDNETVTLSQNINEQEMVADTITILKSCIVDEIKLGELKFAENS